MANENRYDDKFALGRAYGRDAPDNTIALDQAGTRQFAPNIDNIAGNSPYVQRNVIPILLQAPRFFQFMDNSQMWVRSLKAIVERHTRNVTGLNRSKNVDYAEAPVGGSGERIQVPINVTREVSSPVHTMNELQGRAVARFFDDWISWGIQDENTGHPLVISNGNVRNVDYDATFSGMTVLYFEPDATFTEVVAAWLCTNMMPTNIPWEGQMDASQGGQYNDISMTFTAMTDISVGTMNLARNIMQSMNLGGMNPQETAILINKVSADVAAADNGRKEDLDWGAANRVTYASNPDQGI